MKPQTFPSISLRIYHLLINLISDSTQLELLITQLNKPLTPNDVFVFVLRTIVGNKIMSYTETVLTTCSQNTLTASTG